MSSVRTDRVRAGISEMTIEFFNNELVQIWGSVLKETESVLPIRISEFSYSPTQIRLIGTLLIDFLETNFIKQDHFNYFVQKWGLGGLIKHSQTVREISPLDLTAEKYSQQLYDVWNEVKEILKEIQDKFKKVVYYCLDSNGPDWSHGLNTLQRLFVMLQKDEKLCREFMSFGNNINVGFGPAFDHSSIKVMTFDQMTEFTTKWVFGSEEELAKSIKNMKFTLKASYSSPDIASILYVELQQMIANNLILKQCENCGRYFIPPRPNAKYCNRPLSQDDKRTCKDVGAAIKHAKRTDKDPYQVVYRRVYKTVHARTPFSKKAEFQSWVKKAKQKLEEARKGNITIEEFEQWAKEGL